LLPQINKQFEILFNKNQHILQVQVVSSFGDVNLESIKNILSKKYQQQKFALTQIKNPQILGGLQINIENTVIDISLKNNLLQIQKHLINSLN
jgi:F0F1-type ATP synthase delta subunit